VAVPMPTLPLLLTARELSGAPPARVKGTVPFSTSVMENWAAEGWSPAPSHGLNAVFNVPGVVEQDAGTERLQLERET